MLNICKKCKFSPGKNGIQFCIEIRDYYIFCNIRKCKIWHTSHIDKSQTCKFYKIRTPKHIDQWKKKLNV